MSLKTSPIIAAVTAAYGVRFADIRSRCRDKPLPDARKALAHCLRRLGNVEADGIGRMLNITTGWAYAVVRHAEGLMPFDRQYAARMRQIEAMFDEQRRVAA